MKILVVYPSPDMKAQVFTEALEAVKDIDRGGHILDYFFPTNIPSDFIADKGLGFNLEKARQVALTQGYDYMLIVESDIIPPKDCLLKMLKVNADVVVSLTPERHEKVGTFYPIVCMGWNNNPEALPNFLKGTPFRVHGCAGFTLTLINRKVIEGVRFPIEAPCDFTWYAVIHRMGFSVVCDPSIWTKQIERAGRIARGKDSVLSYWKIITRQNELQKKGWYFGLPETWWYGWTREQFLNEMASHLDDPQWWSPKLQPWDHVELGGGPRPQYHPNLDALAGEGVDWVVDLAKEDLPFFDATVGHFYSSHFLEHLTYKRAIQLLRDCYRALWTNGRIELVIPDMEKAIGRHNIDRVVSTPETMRIILGEQTNEYHYHQGWYSRDLVGFILYSVGFRDVKLTAERTGVDPCFTIEARKP